MFVFFVLFFSQASSVEAVPRISEEQAKKKQLASALFTGLSGPAQRPSRQRKGGGERERGSRPNTEERMKAQETSQLIDLEVSMCGAQLYVCKIILISIYFVVIDALIIVHGVF